MQTYKRIKNLTTGQDQLVSQSIINTLLETKQPIEVFDGDFYINNGLIVKLETKKPYIDTSKINNINNVNNKPTEPIIIETSEDKDTLDTPITKNIIKSKNK